MRRGILASREELRQLRDRIPRKPFDNIYDFLRKRCSLILESSPITETNWRVMSSGGSYAAGVLAARSTQGRVIDLLVAHHIEPNAAFRDRAIEELKLLAGWSQWFDPSHGEGLADLCTAEAATAAVIGLDWLWEDLSEPDRLRVLHAIRHKAIEPYMKAVAAGAWWYNCYHAWNAVVNSGCGLAGLALSDELPLAGECYKQAMRGLRSFFSALGREGGWDEGLGYWGYALRYVLLLGEAAGRTLDDHSIFHSRGIDTTGYFPIYFTPNGQPASFGDMPSAPLLGTMYLLVKHFGQREVTWWLDTYAFHRDVTVADWSAAGLAMLFRPIDAELPSSPDLRPLKVFNEIGWAAIADAWPRPRMYVAAKTGDLAAHHSQHDMNCVQIQVNGEMLLTDLGHGTYSREYFSDARQGFYEVQACAHNTATVGGRDHRLDAQGSIIEAQTDANYRWVACDAGVACGELVHYVRHVIMLVSPGRQEGQGIIVLDELMPRGERVDLFWHTMGRIAFDLKTLSGSITGQQSRLFMTVASNVALHAKQETRTIGPAKSDSILQLTSPPTSRVMIATVFTQEPLSGKLEIKRASTGEVRLRGNGIDLHFRGLRRHLQLDRVAF